MKNKILALSIVVGSIFLFLSIMVIGNKQIQIGEEFYGFSLNGMEHYSWCKSQASPGNQLYPTDSKMLCNGDDCKIEIKSDKFNLSLSNPTTRTGSMSPSLPDGSKLIIREPVNDDYFIGDIVCFWDTNNIGYQICHRIIEVRDTQIKTKGDNSISDDGLINKKDVVSVAVGVLF